MVQTRVTRLDHDALRPNRETREERDTRGGASVGGGCPYNAAHRRAAHEGRGSGGSLGGLFFTFLRTKGLFEQLLGLLRPLPSKNPDVAAL